jgi:hypothetical protein
MDRHFLNKAARVADRGVTVFIAVAVKYRATLNTLPSRNQSIVQAKDLLFS